MWPSIKDRKDTKQGCNHIEISIFRLSPWYCIYDILQNFKKANEDCSQHLLNSDCAKMYHKCVLLFVWLCLHIVFLYAPFLFPHFLTRGHQKCSHISLECPLVHKLCYSVLLTPFAASATSTPAKRMMGMHRRMVPVVRSASSHFFLLRKSII